jgi:hypothetical protein
MKKNKFVYIDVFDDQGGGGSYCSNCNYNLTWIPSIESLEEHWKKSERCPGCKSVFRNENNFEKENVEKIMMII